MKCCQSVDSTQLKNLLTGVTGIYLFYFVTGLLHESVIKDKFTNIFTGTEQQSTFTFGMVLIPSLVAWLCALTYNKICTKQKTQIPRFNGILCGGANAFTSVLSMIAIMYTSFPVVVMFESCNVLSVVLVGVFCTRTVDRSVRLSKNKIIIAAIVTFGILLFEFSDSESKARQMKSNIVGIVALSVWVVVEGFFPDLQAEIKTKYKPQPSEMMEVINKWATIAVFAVMVISWNLLEFCLFMVTHPFFTLELFVSAFFAAFGQFFVYRMIKHFKQHVLPFTITTRKLFTVWLSIIFFDHQTNWMQSLGIMIVMATVAFDFSIEVSKPVKLPVQQFENEDLSKSTEQIKITQTSFDEKTQQ